MGANKSKELSASLEDYLEAILNLSAEDNIARSKDISELLEVSKSSVTGALRVLSEKELVNYKPYGFVTLTEAGREAASRVARKHDIIKLFFVNILGVDRSVSHKAACRAEHALGPRIVGKLLSFIEFVTQSSENGYDLAKEFKRFCEENEKDIAEKGVFDK